MEWLVETLGLLLAGLASILSAVGALAAVRLKDPRLAVVTGALVLLALLGLFAFLHEASPRYGEEFSVDPIPLGLALGATVLLYGSLFRRRPRPTA